MATSPTNPSYEEFNLVVRALQSNMKDFVGHQMNLDLAIRNLTVAAAKPSAEGLQSVIDDLKAVSEGFQNVLNKIDAMEQQGPMSIPPARQAPPSPLADEIEAPKTDKDRVAGYK
jgi:hypothetical protein